MYSFQLLDAKSVAEIAEVMKMPEVIAVANSGIQVWLRSEIIEFVKSYLL